MRKKFRDSNQFKLTKVNGKKLDKKVKNDKTMDYCDVISH